MTARRKVYYYKCSWCEHKPEGYKNAAKLRQHVCRHHPQVSQQELEYSIVATRYPTVIDELVRRYRDRLETIITLLDKGYSIQKYLQTIGVCRDYRADLAIGAVLKNNPPPQTAEEVTKALADRLINKFRVASPEVRFQGYLNRDLSVLAKAGHEDLIPAVRTLKTIRFVQKQLREALEADTTESGDSTQLGE